jgi:hypothetical protein
LRVLEILARRANLLLGENEQQNGRKRASRQAPPNRKIFLIKDQEVSLFPGPALWNRNCFVQV